MKRTVIVSPVEPAPLSIRSPMGVDLDLEIDFLSLSGAAIDPDTLMPQLALLPRSRGGVSAFDMGTLSKAAGSAEVTVPGIGLNDACGYTIEVYQRREAANPADPAVPVGLLAKGVLRMEGSAYQSMGPLSPITVPVVVGPPGAPGADGAPGAAGAPGSDGMRGSIWTTGSGDPIALGVVNGDMYLDNATGNVWRWDGATSTWMLT